MSAKTRKWIYNVAIAAFAVLVFYGYVTDVEVANWLFLLTTILGIGSTSLARNNLTPDKPAHREPPRV